MGSDMENVVLKDRFAALIGAELIEANDGYALMELVIREDHLNGVGIVQGGVTYALADIAFAAAANSKGLIALGIHGEISYFKAPKGKKLLAEAREVSSSNKLCCYSVDVFDEDRTLIARFSGNGYIKR